MAETFSSFDFGFLEKIKNELIEVGEELTFRRVIRHYEIEYFPGINNLGQEVHGVFFNARHDRSVSVWITDFYDSLRADGIGCKVQLWGKPESSSPDAHHSTRLSKQMPVCVSGDSISAAVCKLLGSRSPVSVA